MAIAEELQILVNAKVDAAVRDLKKTQAETNKLGASAKNLVKSLLPVAGAAAGLLALARGAKAAESAFFEQEKAVALLNAALRTTGQFSEETSSDIQKFASDLQAITTVGDEASIKLAQYAVSAGLSAKQSKQATKDAIGLSKAFGIDLNAAIKATVNAQQGNFDMLNRYLPAVKNAKDETEKASIAQQQLANAFSVAQAEAKTAVGVQQQYANAVGDTAEKMGELVSEALTPARAALRDIVTEFNNTTDAQDALKESAADIGDAIAGIIQFGDAIIGVGVSINDALDGLGKWRTTVELLVGGPLKAMVEVTKAPIKFVDMLIDRGQKQEEIAQAQWGYSQAILEDKKEQAVVSEEIADSEQEIQDRLQAQIDILENRYKGVRSEVLSILDSEKTELQKLGEQYDELAANPWASGKLEDDRQAAMAILLERMGELRTAEYDWATEAEAAWNAADEAFFANADAKAEALEEQNAIIQRQQDLVLALGSIMEDQLASVVTSSFGAIGEALVEGENAMKSFAKASLLGVAATLDAIAQQLAAYAVVGLFTTGGALSPAALAGAAAAATAAGVVRASAGSFREGTPMDQPFTVPGTPGRDSQPIMVEPGEEVTVNSRARSANGGSQMANVVLNIDGRAFGKVLLDLSRDRVVTIDRGALVAT